MDSFFRRMNGGHPRSPNGALLSFRTSIDCDGRWCSQRLIVEDGHLGLCNPAPENGDPDHEERRWRREEIEAFRVEHEIGSAFLQAKVDGRWQDVLRCPSGSSEKLRRFVARLDQWLESGHGSDGQVQAMLSGKDASASLDAADPGRDANRSARPKRLSQWFQSAVPWETSAPSGWQTARHVLAIIHPFRGKAVLVLALSLIAVGIELAPPMLQKALVDQVLDVEHIEGRRQELLSLLLAIVVGLLLFRLASTVVAIWKGYLGSVIGTSLTAALRNRLVEKLHRLPLAFHDRHQVGTLMSRVAYDTETMHTLLHHITSGFLLQVLQLVGIGVMLFYLNPKLAAITMLPMPVILFGSWYFTRYLYPRHHRYWEAVGKQAAALTGMLSGIRVVKSFAQENREWRRFCRSSHRLRDCRQTVDITTVGFTSMMGFLFGLGGLAVWYVGGRDILADRMTLGSLMAFLAYLAMFYAPLTSLAEAVTWFSSFLAASHRIFGLLESTEEEEQRPESLQKLRPVRGAITFDNVTFGYHSDQTVLDRVTCRIHPGETVGIAGRSGSGKSTLVSLIGRLYELRSGQITIDGVDVRELNSRELRRNIGMVLQDPFLFPGSVAENIAYGHPDATPEEIITAARNADSHDFIMRLPYGYDTQLGEGGCGLSGGERQRISIARALIFDPPILIFDEATASIDALAEESILRAVRRVAHGRTMIVIAHRLSTIRDADRLLVFDRGRLVEQGTHDTLVHTGGLYSTLVTIQMNSARPRRAVDGDGTLCERNGHGKPHWLNPSSTQVDLLSAGRLRVSSTEGDFDNVYALRTFPARSQDEFLSLRHRDETGCEREIGMIRTLVDWPTDVRPHLLASLGRRYLLHHVLSIHKVHSLGDRLCLVMDTDRGRTQSKVERPDENVQPYGQRGIMLTATDGSLYVITDFEQLPARQQRFFATFVGE